MKVIFQKDPRSSLQWDFESPLRPFPIGFINLYLLPMGKGGEHV